MQVRKSIATVILAIVLSGMTVTSPAENGEVEKPNPAVLMETSLGNITIELWQDKAPTTVKNFLRYVDEKFYDNTIFHRVISGFMIQGGGFMADMKRKNTREPIENEASPDLRNETGTIAMARTREIHSATSQFFINVADNAFLNHRDETPRGYGYAVFGRVTGGEDVVMKISTVKTTRRGPYQDVPAEPVVIKSVRRIDSDK